MLADNPLEDFLIQVAEPEATGGLSLYLMLDQSGLPNIRPLWPALLTLAWRPVMGSHAAQPDGAVPLLIDISTIASDAAMQRAIRMVYAQGRFANCLCVLQSRLDLDRLAAALRQRTRAELPDRLAVVLRYFDTRTLPLLPRLLTPPQLAAFMSCAAGWHYVDRHGQVQSLPPGGCQRAEVSSINEPLTFNADQERMLIDDGLIDAVIDQLLDQRHPVLAETTPGQQHVRVAALVETAGSYGIDDVLDAVRYCHAAFEHGDDFHLREPWVDRLRQLRLGQMQLAEALGEHV